MQTFWSIFRTGLVVLITAFTLVVGIHMGSSVYHTYFALPNEVEVPLLVNVDKGEAEKILDRLGLKLEVRETRFQPKVGPNKIISQDPPGGRKVRQGREVSVSISRGPETDNVPDVTGMTLREARLTLENAKLLLGKVVRKQQEDTKSEEVLDQKPAAGVAAPKGTKVALTVSLSGKAAVTLPNYEGMSLEEVRERIESDGLRLGTITWVIDPKAGVAEVVRQNPGPRVALAADAPVSLVVCAGNDPKDLEVHKATVDYLVPAGQQNQTIRMDVTDPTGTSTVFQATMSPGQKVSVEVSALGDGDLMIYADDQLIKREKL